VCTPASPRVESGRAYGTLEGMLCSEVNRAFVPNSKAQGWAVLAVVCPTTGLQGVAFQTVRESEFLRTVGALEATFPVNGRNMGVEICTRLEFLRAKGTLSWLGSGLACCAIASLSSYFWRNESGSGSNIAVNFSPEAFTAVLGMPFDATSGLESLTTPGAFEKVLSFRVGREIFETGESQGRTLLTTVWSTAMSPDMGVQVDGESEFLRALLALQRFLAVNGEDMGEEFWTGLEYLKANAALSSLNDFASSNSSSSCNISS
jgi:hypothetical protein